MGHFFDALKVDFTHPAIRELVDMFGSHFELLEEIRQLAKDAGVRLGRVNLQKGVDLVWPDVLQASRDQELHWKLIEAAKRTNPAVGRRIDELLTQPRPILEAKAQPRGSAVWREWKGTEAQTGPRSTLLDVDFLNKGIGAAAAVCKLITYGRDGAEGWGSGFLIGPDLVLSNHHVLCVGDDEGAGLRGVEVLFRYETGTSPVTIAGRVDTILGDRAFDWAVVRLAKPTPDGCRPLKLGSSRPVKVGDPAFIVQHPGGGPKQVGLYRNEIRHVDDDVVQYLTDTRGGSSGSPVCNERWEVVALHQRWLEANAATGNEVRNQGIRVERVLAGLQANDLARDLLS